MSAMNCREDPPPLTPSIEYFFPRELRESCAPVAPKINRPHRQQQRPLKIPLLSCDTLWFAFSPRLHLFELHIGFNYFWEILFRDLHEPESFRPDHHVGPERAKIKAPAPSHAQLTFKVHFFGHPFEIFRNILATTITAGWALAFSIIDADKYLAFIRLWSLNHENPRLFFGISFLFGL